MTFSIGIENPSSKENIGTLFRSAYQLGASSVFTIGKKYSRQRSDTFNTCKHIPYYYYESLSHLFESNIESFFVAIEENNESLLHFSHPQMCVYVLGNEKTGLSEEALKRCNLFATIPSIRNSSYNVSMAGTIVMYDRLVKTHTL